MFSFTIFRRYYPFFKRNEISREITFLVQNERNNFIRNLALKLNTNTLILPN